VLTLLQCSSLPGVPTVGSSSQTRFCMQIKIVHWNLTVYGKYIASFGTTFMAGLCIFPAAPSPGKERRLASALCRGADKITRFMCW
jgi:hypothetical protein